MRPGQAVLLVVGVGVAVGVAVGALGACGGASSGGGRSSLSNQGDASGADFGTRVTTAAQAIDAFRVTWTAAVVPNVPAKERAMTEAIDATMKAAPDKFTARLASCREGHEVVQRTITQTQYDFVIHGQLADLDRDGACWHVMYAGGMKQEVLGYVDPGTGKLLLVWRIPEG